MKRVEFGICGLDVTVPREALKGLFQAPAGCALEAVAAFQLAYQGYPWNPAKGYESRSDTKHRRYENGETYPAWYEIEEIIAALPHGTKLSFHFNDSSECRYVSSLLQGEPEALRLVQLLCQRYKARHIQVNISSRGVAPDLFMPSPRGSWEKSASCLVQLAEMYPETLFLVPVFQSGDIDSLPFLQLVLDMSKRTMSNLLAFFDNSAGEGVEPSRIPDIPPGYPAGGPIGFAGGIRAENVKEWLSKYHSKAAAAGCWAICDAQSGFRKKGNRGEPIDLEELTKLLQQAFEWGSLLAGA